MRTRTREPLIQPFIEDVLKAGSINASEKNDESRSQEWNQFGTLSRMMAAGIFLS
jgi:hypothetical protein